MFHEQIFRLASKAIHQILIMRSKIEKILIPTDFSACADVALAQATALARLFQAELHVLHVLTSQKDDPYSLAYRLPDWQTLLHSQQERCAEKMMALLGGMESDGLEIEKHFPLASAPAPAILEFASQQSIDLIVMGTHGRRGFRRFLAGSVAEEVVRLAPCPVLTVGETTTPLRHDWPGRITVPIDFSGPSRIALRAAKELAAGNPAKKDTTLDLVYVFEQQVDLNPVNPLDGWTAEVSFPQIARQVEEAIAKFNRETGGPETHCNIEVLEGRAAETIAQHAKASEADLIMIATRGLTGVQHFLLGSVAERVLRVASCPVLTLRGADTTTDP